ncbi:prolyl oligopeptidase [Lipingzhangella halophila]|uniref:prolyl oligopeptidase n=1 Tax=Lipingzhangella halophila TaxID=1783352 RepID=A0A7W7RKM4_9ACTN|nr:prolyl oligopeptidase family serine peptidase [Lipingzhangella halophila]MBB4933251.1 prolyl oligopeptidase [Lipingzhangella halophila]
MPDRCRYPAAERVELSDIRHGHTVADPYRWLEEPNSPQTKEWSAAQDALFANAAADLPARDWFGATIRELMAAGTIGAPVWRGGRRFFTRRTPAQEHEVLVTVPSGSGTEHILLDPHALGPDGTTTLDSWDPDHEGRLLAYQLSVGGDEEAQLWVMDVASGETVDGPIDRCRNTSIAWLPGGAAFCYVRRLPAEEVPEGEEAYHRRVYLHEVGTPADRDVLVFGAGGDKICYYGVAVSHDGRWLLVERTRGTSASNDAWIADLRETGAHTPRFVPIQRDVDARTTGHVGRDGRLYLLTDRGAPRGRLCVTDPAKPGYAHWRTLVHTDAGAVLRDFAILDGPEMAHPVLLASWRRRAISEITVHDLDSGEWRGSVPLPGLGSVGGLTEHPEGGHEAWFGYTDNSSPTAVYRYDGRTSEAALWEPSPGTLELPEVRTEQVTYTSRDGTPVQMLLLSPHGAGGPRPTILYGYGGFAISLTPAYSAVVLAWVRAGGSFAIANLRGGLEEGEEWHRAGMLGAKQNVFDDFASAAEHLVKTGVTSPGQLAAKGGSNGGLLVGAALTQRPELFAAAVCSAPLLDMVRYEHFGLGQLWNVEYGSADDPESLGWLLDYSPYHNVTEGLRYPATLFTVFDNDTRVDPLHARKMCAALQHATAAPVDERPIVLRRESEVGHSARAVSRSVRLSADQLAFLARFTGLRLPQDAGTAG